MNSNRHIVVIGAGLVGCLLARMLALRGYTVSVYERRKDPNLESLTSGRSTHLVISVRGWKALDLIKARDKVLPETIPLKGRRIHKQDKSRIFQPYGKDNQTIFAIQRRDLNKILVDLCRHTAGVSMYFSHKCVDVEPESGSVIIEDVDTGKQNRINADYIFAADGAFSWVRKQILYKERFNYIQTYENYGYKELTLPSSITSTMEKDAMHAWPRGKVSLFAFPNQDDSFTATILAPLDGKDGFESMREHHEIIQLFENKFSDINPVQIVDGFMSNPISSLSSVRCSPWTFGNRLALIGDAAHAMVPFLGQGMNAGFEDCTVINTLLDEYNDNFTLMFKEYEKLRRPNCEAITTLSSQNFYELTEKVGDEKFHFKNDLERKIRNLYPNRFAPAYELIAFTHVPYSEAFEKITKMNEVTSELIGIYGDSFNFDNPAIEKNIHTIVDKYQGETI